MKQGTYYRTVQVDRLSIFYRAAGPRDAPTLLLLHGLPSSSRMFEPLLSRLSSRYHMIAPDYPGFGHSDAPSHKQFAYTFDHIAAVMNHFAEALGLSQYVLYMQDYGGPIGFRMTLSHPDRVNSLIIQNAVSHNIQSDLIYDYRTNVATHPTWQAWVRKAQPRLLVLWGGYDPSFELSEAEAYRADVPGAQVHILDADHFALDTAAEEIASLIRAFVN